MRETPPSLSPPMFLIASDGVEIISEEPGGVEDRETMKRPLEEFLLRKNLRVINGRKNPGFIVKSND